MDNAINEQILTNHRDTRSVGKHSKVLKELIPDLLNVFRIVLISHVARADVELKSGPKYS